jgi:hypothetical protein
MQVVFSSLPTLAVSAIYCVWYAYQKERLRRDRTLRERVAYMLWVAADRVE